MSLLLVRLWEVKEREDLVGTVPVGLMDGLALHLSYNHLKIQGKILTISCKQPILPSKCHLKSVLLFGPDPILLSLCNAEAPVSHMLHVIVGNKMAQER